MDREQVVELYHLGHNVEEICEQLNYDSEQKQEVQRIISALERED